MSDLEQLVEQARQDFAAAASPALLEQAKARYLGKSGSITAELKGLAALAPEEKKEAGGRINRAKQSIEAALEARRAELRKAELDRQLAATAIDVTLPGRQCQTGGLHPVSRAQERIEDLFRSVGFTVADGPEIESDWYNFTALNMPDNHPARSMHDTFYLQGRDDVLLRTHTSPVQIRAMQAHVARYGTENMPDLRIIAPGRTYRVDWDATHSPMFHQLEGMWIGEKVSMADLKGLYTHFLRRFFETDELEVRFRPSFFPFTEPSAEIDMAFLTGKHKGKWLEISGCGMMHPNVLAFGGIDPERYTGFAFGSGLERLAMLLYGIDDIRLFFENDLRFLSQFR